MKLFNSEISCKNKMCEGNPDERFEEELIWCVDQLQIGLETQNPNSKQAIEATKILKILLSSKAPLIKKRQAMRNAFGDYKKKMKETEKKSLAAVNKARLSAGDSSQLKSHFFKKSSHKPVLENQSTSTATAVNQSTELSGAQSTGNVENQNNNAENQSVSKTAETDTGADHGLGFKFDFSICEETSVLPGMTETNNTPSGETSTRDKSSSSTIAFEKTDNSFRFNFQLSE